MPTLYTMPGTCSLSPNIAVAWLDAPVAIHNIPYGDQKKEYYLAINPRGQVPALRFEDGAFTCSFQQIRRHDHGQAAYFERDWAEFLTGGIYAPGGG